MARIEPEDRPSITILYVKNDFFGPGVGEYPRMGPESRKTSLAQKTVPPYYFVCQKRLFWARGGGDPRTGPKMREISLGVDRTQPESPGMNQNGQE